MQFVFLLQIPFYRRRVEKKSKTRFWTPLEIANWLLVDIPLVIFSLSFCFKVQLLNEQARFYDVKVDVEDHNGHCSLCDQYCAARSGAGWPGIAIGTLTPGDIKPKQQFQTINNKSISKTFF